MSVLAASLRQAGLNMLKAGRLDDALSSLQQALQADPQSYETWTYIGAVRSQRGEHDVARHAFGRAVQLNPQSAKLRFNLGKAHEGAGDIEAARVCYDAALSLDPAYAQAQDAREKLPEKKIPTMSELASVGGSVRLPGAHRAEVSDEELHGENKALTPQEIARLAMPQGHLHMMGAQATDMVADEEKKKEG